MGNVKKKQQTLNFRNCEALIDCHPDALPGSIRSFFAISRNKLRRDCTSLHRDSKYYIKLRNTKRNLRMGTWFLFVSNVRTSGKTSNNALVKLHWQFAKKGCIFYYIYSQSLLLCTVVVLVKRHTCRKFVFFRILLQFSALKRSKFCCSAMFSKSCFNLCFILGDFSREPIKCKNNISYISPLYTYCNYICHCFGNFALLSPMKCLFLHG